MKFFITGVIALGLLFSCNMKERADLILINGVVYTADSAFSKCTAFAVKDGKIVATGSDEQILSKYSAGEYVDAERNPVYPGFNDAHGHFFELGESLAMVDLRGTRSYSEIIERLQKAAEGGGKSYLAGDGWDQNDWPDKTMPDNTLLNEIFPDIPVVITRIDYHAVVANDAAINLLGIKPGDPSVPSDEAPVKDGKFTGLFLEKSSERLRLALPSPSLEEYNDMMKRAQSECLRYGVTSLSTAGETLEKIQMLRQFQNSKELKMRIDVWLSATKENTSTFSRPIKEGLINITSIKLYVDGALGSRGAWMIESYSDDSGNRGIKVADDAEYRWYLNWAYDHGFQAATHCIGDAANRYALREYARILEGNNDRRWRIEHSQVIAPSDFEYFRKYNIIPSIQPTHATSDMIWAADRLGPRIKGAYAYKELLDCNGWLPSGTDFPIESVNPVYTFFAAVFRKNSEFYPQGGFEPTNALSREEALRSMTIWAAKASFEDEYKGSLEAGRYADFVILNTDLMTAPEKEVYRAKVIKTFVAGKEVYSDNQSLLP